ncbi:MAG: M48 family metalloprotease [Xanthomonadales bacterium]|nr:M48 family metalloprotease [Xanthomonadales bacterium]
MSRKPKLLAWIAVAALLAGCASQQPLRDMAPGERPPEDTDEAGLWMALDESEMALQRSPLLIRDAGLNAYVKKLVCDLAGEYCRDIRVYIIRRPYFNASMAPNGVMQVWTGALLRSENEAQLGFVLGHEIGHFLHQHSIKQWRRTKDIMNALSILQLVAASAGTRDAYDIFDVSQLVAYASLYKYSRDAERESDTEGFERAVKLGYRADQGALLWQGLLAEDNARDRNKPSGIFATHPATEERMTTLREAAEAFANAGSRTGEEGYRSATEPFFASWLDDEMGRRHYPQTIVLLDRLQERATGSHLAWVDYYRGELFRKRRAGGDDKRAIDAYRAAMRISGYPPIAHRDLGYMYRTIQQPALAASEWREYLKLKPDAADRATVEHYLSEATGAAHAN